jgi:hypothetical protein
MHLQIAREALKLDVDLGVVGEGRQRLFFNHLIGTTAGRLLRQQTVPMISLRSQPTCVVPGPKMLYVKPTEEKC